MAARKAAAKAPAKPPEPDAPDQAEQGEGLAVPDGHRTETYTDRRPDGTRVRITRDVETGQSTVTDLGG